MALDLDLLEDEVLAFLAESHLASLTTIRADGTPHVAPVGFSYDADHRLARIITFPAARRIGHIGDGAPVALCQIDGGRWLTLEGHATVTDDPARVAEAVERYAQRYRLPGDRPDRLAIEVQVTRMMGRA